MPSFEDQTPPWLKNLKRNLHWFEASGKLLQTVYAAREGGPLSLGLAVINAAGVILENVVPDESVWGWPHRHGFVEHDTCIGEFLCDTLLKSGEPYQIMAADLSNMVIVWSCGVAAVYSRNGEHQGGPYLDAGAPGAERNMLRAIQDYVWRNNHDLMLIPKTGGRRGYTEGWDLDPMQSLGRYVGKKDPDWYAHRMRAYGDRPRTIVFRGPTGVGKSVLARHIARKLGHGEAKTLKIASSVLHDLRHNQLLALVRYLEPKVLLLDDLDLENRSNTEKFLAVLEVLRTPDCLVIVTMMTMPEHVEREPKPGSWHFPGMRPDRIDEMFTLYLPDEDERYEILAEYLKDVRFKKKTLRKVAQRTENLSGAYLMEVARRLIVHGFDEWEREVDNVLWTAPAPPSEEEEEGEESGSSGEIKKLATNARRAVKKITGVDGASIDMTDEEAG